MKEGQGAQAPGCLATSDHQQPCISSPDRTFDRKPAAFPRLYMCVCFLMGYFIMWMFSHGRKQAQRSPAHAQHHTAQPPGYHPHPPLPSEDLVRAMRYARLVGLTHTQPWVALETHMLAHLGARPVAEWSEGDAAWLEGWRKPGVRGLPDTPQRGHLAAAVGQMQALMRTPPPPPTSTHPPLPAHELAHVRPEVLLYAAAPMAQVVEGPTDGAALLRMLQRAVAPPPGGAPRPSSPAAFHQLRTVVRSHRDLWADR